MVLNKFYREIGKAVIEVKNPLLLKKCKNFRIIVEATQRNIIPMPSESNKNKKEGRVNLCKNGKI